MNRRTTIATIVVGIALLVGAPAIWFASQPAHEVGDLGAMTSSPTEPPGDGSGGTDADPDGPDGADDEVEPLPTPGSADTVPLSAGELSGPLSHHPVPVRLGIETLGVDAQVVPVSLEDDGSMEIPEDVDQVGWYEPGVRPGQDGTAVLSGHVDSREQGPGVLFDLRAIDVGDRITTAGPDGEPMQWNVVARARYGKAELPIDDIFVWSGPPRLVVITCGGDFDAAARSYSENVVVYAEPA